ncbi:MAG: prepilin-type N-terminal cleavage/methylation domain-containing protein [Desulfobacterales bacterium]|nr:MAG: prepilin-type N-terminal cleavage/methylation domain-containing protein [Desulfobacterales bacterium]
MGRDARGFTLFEMVVAMAVMAIAIQAIVAVWTAYSHSYTVESVVADVQQSVRAALGLIEDDIRMAGLDPTGSAAAGIDQASLGATNLQFTSDRNGDGDIDEANYERITYFYNNADKRLDQILFQGTPSETSPQALIDNVSNFAFTYLDEDGAPTFTADEIRTVLITLSVRAPAGRGETVTRTMRSRINCRNLGGL